MVSSDPHAWLRPLYRQLAADRDFALISPFAGGMAGQESPTLVHASAIDWT